jgi:hypothetical protein
MTEVKRILDCRSCGKVAFSRHRLCVRALVAAIACREGAQEWDGNAFPKSEKLFAIEARQYLADGGLKFRKSALLDSDLAESHSSIPAG